MKLQRILCLLCFSLLAPGLVLAHAHLSASVPGKDAVVNEAPGVFELSFTEEVQLLKFAITGSNGKAVETEFTPSADAQQSFAVPLPMLGQDSYTVNWTILGDDGHRVEDSLSFTVDANAGAATEAVTEPHPEHSH